MRVTYHRRCRPSGRRLAEALADVESDIVLNWGRGQLPDGDYINQPSAVRMASDKGWAIAVMGEGGAPVPDWTDDVETAAGWICSSSVRLTSYGARLVGRATNHRGGSGLWLCTTSEDVLRSHRMGADYWLRAIDAIHEYRVHVVGDKVIKTSEKLHGEGVIRTKANGWKFKVPTTSYEERQPVRRAARRAVRALGLDFGAADVLVDAYGNAYVTEVNTAPSLTDPNSTTFTRYVEAITDLALREDTE